MLRRLAEKKRKKKRFKNKRDHEWVVQCHRCGLVGDNYETICSVCGEGKWQLITPVNIPAWDLLSRPSVGGARVGVAKRWTGQGKQIGDTWILMLDKSNQTLFVKALFIQST